MTELNEWQWAIGAAALMTLLAIGGWLSNREAGDSADSESEVLNETTSSSESVNTNDLTQLRQQLEVRERELKDAKEEAELTLLQLRQVQEELEHYFLESRELQQKLDAMQNISPAQQAQLKRINARLLKLFKTLPASGSQNAHSQSSNQLEALVMRQQNALHRFQALQNTN